ncbi:MAG: 16S rRNA (uracil(1498)-N(3))-methyltransferase [Chloroflexi bacterium]|nr:16S rRNA (uracil(1498)-N(3))-methyltransferase [Chloroflexota bacterium]
MSEPRFFIPPDARHGERVTFSPEQSRQISKVLRLRPGSVVYALDNAGWIYTVRLETVGRERVVGRVVDRQAAGGEPPLEVILYVALLKGEKMDWVLQKGTEVGVTQFVPMLTRRAVVRRREVKARWERILQEAAEQSGRAFIPRLAPVHSWEEALEHAVRAPLCLLAHPSDAVPLRRLWESTSPPDRVALLVGPEGGFAEEEVEEARARGCRIVHLGPRILRAETAAVILPALLLHHWGDLG